MKIVVSPTQSGKMMLTVLTTRDIAIAVAAYYTMPETGSFSLSPPDPNAVHSW